VGTYRIEVELVWSWADACWTWRVLDAKQEIVWSGTAATRWGANRKARRAARKYAKGKRQNDRETQNLSYYLYVP
jgi:hypothetical protein